MQYVRGFVGFWKNFIIGDDWLVAALICAALLLAWGLIQVGFRPVFWIVPIVVVVALAASVRRTAPGLGQPPRERAAQAGKR